MYSRKLTITVLFTIILSAGAVFLGPAEAAQTHDSQGWAGASLPEVFSVRALVESVMGLAHTLWTTKTNPPSQNPPPGSQPQNGGEEGPGICPIGHQWCHHHHHGEDGGH